MKWVLEWVPNGLYIGKNAYTSTLAGCVVWFQYAQLNKFENVDTSAFCLTDQRFLFAVGNYRPCVFGVISVGFRLSFNLL